VKYADGIWHCLHPESLADQLERSLGRLQLATLDVCLLHNPEYFLKDGQERSHGTLERRREEFYRRLGESFAWLESQVAAGRIDFYGVSSNNLGAAASDPDFVSLTRLLEVARDAAGGGHHFRVIQLPLNLFESGPALRPNNGDGATETVLAAAARHGLGVLVNRPLNAIADAGMLRLADPPRLPAEVDFEMQRQRVGELEAEYRQAFAPGIHVGEGRMRAEDLFRWADDLADVPARLSGLDQWEAIEQQRILPQLLGVVRALDQAMAGPAAEAWSAWRDRYLEDMQTLLGELRRRAAEKTRERVEAVTAVLDPLLPSERRGESLSRKALYVAASTPGVSSVLCGMRRPTYVQDALGILPWPPLPDVPAVYRRFLPNA
jgi:aryl-alcohol dehydrogenase-like predicted oxidoreductase